jgi:CsoR family transcriptional regulator, copper-sensing transcriptional repressor
VTTSTLATTDRADRVAAKLSGPVLVAALASIPATFLTLFDGHYATVGTTLNVASGAVLVAETVVLLALAEDRRAWLGRNRWLVALTLAIIPAIVFAIGPVQLLRLLRIFGALRILRVRRILKAGRIIRERYGFTTGWERAVTLLLTLATAAFVAIVLADPTSESRRFLEDTVGRFGALGVLIAGAIVAVATFVVRANRDG